ncbi:MAG TPA: HAMP domain-containing sensor histidine kinase [Candidatus Limnocylindrales bacterium]|nr:HAMP domain-containing sensor histidine kinase [Candidatus Limnocylindrales bacterium]
MSGTRSPSAEGRAEALAEGLAPRTLQGRLTLAFVAVVAVTLGLVGLLVVNRLGAYFEQQQTDDLRTRADAVARYVIDVAEAQDRIRAGRPVISIDGELDSVVGLELQKESQQRFIAERLAQADVQYRIGTIVDGEFFPAANGAFSARDEAEAQRGQLREPVSSDRIILENRTGTPPYAVEVILSNPFTYRSAAIQNVTGLLAIIGLIALSVAVVVAAALTRRITTPVRRLTEASRDLAEGDFARRVPSEVIDDGPVELSELGLQFNAMAERLQESVEIIRRDRDRSREFLADVSHELRTPIAALRTFNELLTEGAADDPSARAEFLETSRAQLERLDWLAQNLLELSKLDSGLVLLDLRPEDLRASVEQAVEQAAATARRKGVELTMARPDAPLPIRHDPVRIGQVVANLVGNAIKFTPRGGAVRVDVQPEPGGSASITVTDTGIGIEPGELPRIFDRFFRGSRASEARGSGSGLGLAIVRGIVEMHGGTVTVESRPGAGTTFRVLLPANPRPPAGAIGPSVAETSPSPAQNLNPELAP